MKDLVIKLRMDRTDAKAATDAQVADAKKLENQYKQVGAAQRQAAKEGADATRAAERVKQEVSATTARQYMDANGRMREANGRFVTEGKAGASAVAKANADRVKAALDAATKEQMAHKSTSVSILDMYASANLAEKGFQGLLKVAQGIRDAFKAADEFSRGLRGGFTGEREKLAELAAIQGKEANNDFVAANAKFNKDVGFKPAEGLDFRKEFANSGQQYIGKNISQEEYDDLEKQAGQIAVARGMDPKQAGDFYGKVLGMKDYTKFGKEASEQALGTGNSALEIMKRGSGDNATLISQFNMMASSALNEDEFRGTIKDPNELATLISTAAEKSPASAAEMVKASSRGLRDFSGDAKELLDTAGVNPQTGTIDAIKRIAPVVEKEARESGLKVDDILRKYFHDHLTAEGIGVLINKGVSGGVFADREALAAGQVPGQPRIDGPGPALETIDKFQKSERGQLRVAEATTKETELAEGAKNSRLQTLEEQAKKNLIGRGEMGTTGAEVSDFFMSMTSLGMLDPKQGRLRGEMSTLISDRAKKAGLTAFSDPTRIGNGLSTEAVNEGFNKALTSVEAAEIAAAQKETNRLLKEQVDATKKNAPPVVPNVLAGPPRPMTR